MATLPDRWELPVLERRELAEPDVRAPGRAVATWVVNDGHVLHGFPTDEECWLWSPGFVTFCFTNSGPVAFDAESGRESEASDLWVRSALPLAMQARGTQVLHASALAGPNGVTAICGRTTSGKSTLVQAAQSAQLRTVADDALAFELGDKGIDALTLPFEVRLRPAAAAQLEGSPAAGNGGEVSPLTLVILIDREDEAETPALTTVPPTEALGALMPHAYCFSLATGKEALVRGYAELAERVPVVRLSFRRELDSLLAVVDAIRAVAS
jgi:hypothetical protein